MPIYEFKDSNGNPRDLFFESSIVPKIGDRVQVDGEWFIRVPNFSIDTAGINRKVHKYPYQSSALPRDGNNQKPVIRSQNHEREVAAKMDMVKQ